MTLSPYLINPPARAARTQGWAARHEFLVMQAAVFMAPYIAIRPPGVFVTVSDYLFLLAIVLRLGSGIPSRPFGSLTAPWLIGVLMLCGGLAISSLFGQNPMRSVIVNAQYLFAWVFLPFAVLGRTEDQVFRLVKCAVLAMVVMCIIGMVAYFSGYNGGTERHLAIVTGGRRLVGFVDNANGMASYIVLTLPLLWILRQTGRIGVAFGLACLAILLTGLVLTSSNTGVIGLVIITLILLGGRRNLMTLLIAGTFAYLVVTWGQDYLPQVFQDRVLNAIQKEDISQAGTYKGRSDLNVEAWAIAGDSNLIGLGADQYREESQYGLPVHNTYLLLWVEGGLVAMLGFIWLMMCAIAVPFMHGGRRYSDDVVLATTAVTIVFAGMAMGYTHVYARSLVLPILIVLSPAVALLPRTPAPAPVRPPSRRTALARRDAPGRTVRTSP